jgi:hypothetical protein
VKVAEAESPVPAFVVIVTVYVPELAPEVTVNPLPAVRLPETTEHEDEVKRPDGEEEREHVVPR